MAGRVAGLAPDAARGAADDLVRAGIFAPAGRVGFVQPIVRAALYEDLAPGERQARHAAAAQVLAAEGAPAERVTAHLLRTAPTGDQWRVGTLRAAAMSAIRRGAPRAAAARLQRALAESPAEQERAEILTELGRCEVATMDFAAAEDHLSAALTSDGALTTRAEAASWLGRCAIVSGGRSAQAAADALTSLGEQLRPADPDRSVELGSELLLVTTAVPQLRAGLAAHLERFGDLARGHRGYAALTRIVRAQERLFRGAPATAAVAEVQAALMNDLPPRARTDAVLLALMTLHYGEQYDLATRLLDIALDGARQEGHATRQGLIHGQRAVLALAQGALHDAQVEAETGLLLVARTALHRAAVARGGDHRAHRAGRTGRRGRPGQPGGTGGRRRGPHVRRRDSSSPAGGCGSRRAGRTREWPICCGAGGGWPRTGCCGRATGGLRPRPRWPGSARTSRPAG